MGREVSSIMPPATLDNNPCTASETASEATLSSATSEVEGMPRLCATMITVTI